MWEEETSDRSVVKWVEEGFGHVHPLPCVVLPRPRSTSKGADPCGDLGKQEMEMKWVRSVANEWVRSGDVVGSVGSWVHEVGRS